MSLHIAHSENGPCIRIGEAPEGVYIYEMHKQYCKVLSNSNGSKYVVILGNIGLDAMYARHKTGVFSALQENGNILDKEAVEALLMPDRVVSQVHKTEKAALGDAVAKYEHEMRAANTRYNRLIACV